ncbi:5-formyltetrahydrofolate cyclo-ligase [Microbulbifer guangxiensis]|uniref:5-formyltetrahydrofolate cyclo-ligase n=1 Tax=Microbulbifer guangxiensis TaxID=2904249 RepID=UPI001F0328EE
MPKTNHPTSESPDNASLASSFEGKWQLRRRMRSARRALNANRQRVTSQAVVNRLSSHPALLKARDIALYWPMDGEVDVRGLVSRFADRRFYLPVLPHAPHPQLRFVQWRGESLTYRNRYHIPEPVRGRSRAPEHLDLVLMPLVAFDPSGARLGMGAGFYDRTFAIQRTLPSAGPRLLGIAHQLQCAPFLPTDSWDIPLHGVVTESHSYRCR